MVRIVGGIAAGFLLAAASGTADAQSVTGYGSAVYTTLRACSATPGTICDGTQSNIVQSALSGGAGVEASATFTGTGIGDGSSAYGSLHFGGIGLPSISAAANAAGNVRVNSNVLFYQTYTYSGSDPVDFGLVGNIHIDSSTTDGSNDPDHAGTYAGGAIFTTNLAIWDAASFDTFTDANSFLNDFGAFTGGCGQSGVLAGGGFHQSLPGGEQTYSFATSSCAAGSGAIHLQSGDKFVVAGLMQFPVNRDGAIDATHTFTVTLDPSLGQDTVQALTQNLSYAAAPAAVPEPLTWACMTLGFGAIGASVRRRRTALA